MADVANKQQRTSSFLSTIVTRTRKHTELTKKVTYLMGDLCCAREHSVQFFVQFFFTTCTDFVMLLSTCFFFSVIRVQNWGTQNFVNDRRLSS